MADIVTNKYLSNLLKTVYEEGVVNNKIQGSTLLNNIKKETWLGGDSIEYVTNEGHGGLAGGNIKAQAAAEAAFAYATVPQTSRFKMKYGGISNYFDINPIAIEASDNEKAAFMPILDMHVNALFSRLADQAAVYIFGGQYGVIEQVSEGFTIPAAGTTATITVSASAGTKLKKDTVFQVASAGADNKALPSSPLLVPLCKVTKVKANDDKAEVTFISNAAAEVTVYAGDYIELFGSRMTDSVNNTEYATGYEGLYDILPVLNNRSGDEWEKYIATEFRGVDRSVAEDQLAGHFIKGDSTDPAKAFAQALRDTTIYGATNNAIYTSPILYQKLLDKLDERTYLQQSTLQGAGKRGATFGVNDIGFAFKKAYLDDIKVDTCAFDDIAYSLDPADFVFKSLENAAKVFGPVTNGEIGKPEVNGFGDQGINTKNYGEVDNIFQINGGVSMGTHTYNTRVSGHIVGNTMLKKTASSAVIKF